MPRFKDQAICLRHFEWSQTSQIVVLLTHSRGIVRGVAKGAKRQSPSSVARFSGGIELLTQGQVVAITKSTAELATITEWDLQNDFFYLRNDFKTQELAMYGADLVMAMFGELDAHPRIFDAMAALLENFSQPQNRPESLLVFQWILLLEGGFKPHLDEDIHLRTALDKSRALSFDAGSGGFTQRFSDARWRVRSDTVGLLEAVEKLCAAENNGEKAVGLQDSLSPLSEQFKPQAFVRANKLLCSYIREILGRQLPTMEAVLGAN